MHLFFRFSHPFASLARPPARHPHGGGLSLAVLRAALHPRSTLPPPQRVGLRFPSSVGHGRGLAARPGWAVPGEGIYSARRRLQRFRRVASPRPSRLRLCLRSSMPGKRPNANVSAYKSASTGPCLSGSRLGYRYPTVIAKSSRHRAAKHHGSGRSAAHQFSPYPRRRVSDNIHLC